MIRAMLYSLFLIFTGFFSTQSAISTTLSAHNFKFNDIDGNELSLNKYKGKVILVTNVASFCGFTSQYKGLQSVWDKYKDKDFVLLGVPSNDFYQEYKSEKEVKNFCERTFGVNFPMTEIVSVRGNSAHPFFKWARESYGSSAIPKWNFHKILIDKNGKVVDTYSSMTKPTDKKVINTIEELL
tara:strand:+ start:654 stop:1202 length:549 start_codon:yes stop_codon:yes gene_type:complete